MAWDWGIWSYTATVTQTAVGGGTLFIDVTAGAGNVMEVLYGRAEGTFAAADTLFLESVDEDNNIIVVYAANAAAGTVHLTVPRALTNIDSTTSTSYASSLSGLSFAGPDLKFTAETTALAQNDTVQLLLEAKVKHGPGSVSVARSGGTPGGPVETVNEVY